jgi:hypothetical protein
MSKRVRVFSVPARISVKAHNEEDAIKQGNEALADGLIEPGFVEDAQIEEGKIIELAPVEE